MSREVKDQEKKVIGEGKAQQSDKPFAYAKRPHGDEPEQDQQQEGDGRYIQQGDDAGPYADGEDGRPGSLAVIQFHHAVPYPDHDRVDEQGCRKMAPVRQEGGDQYIGHAGQEVRLWQNLMVIEDPVEKGSLCEKDQEGKDGVWKGCLVEYGIEGTQDQPVQVIVLRVKNGRHRVKEHRKFQYQRIYQ